jgi:response regulator RpfG family c-di-GMP phosphodiesterase/signal transduction histidine kinase
MAAEIAPRAEVSCRALASASQYFEKAYGRERLNGVFATLGIEQTVKQLSDPAAFTSHEVATRLLVALAKAADDPSFSFRAGLSVASPEALGFAYYLLRSFASPQVGYRKVIELAPSYNRAATFTIDELTPTRLVVRYRCHKTEPTRHICEMRMGQFAAIPTIWGLPQAQIVERHCQVNGAPDCLYELTWQPYVQPFVGAATGAAVGAVASGALLYHALGLALGGGLGVVIGGALSLALGYRTQSRMKSEMLQAQDQGLSLSLRDLQQRFDEIQGLNLTLEQKVEDRTKELSIASARLQVALEKQVELDKLKTRFFQNISHELRTPLTLILAPLDSLSADAAAPEGPPVPRNVRMQLDVMRRSAIRLLNMINSLLDLSRLEAGRMRLNLEDMDPAYAARQMVESAQQLAKQRGITLSYVGPERLAPVPLDQDKFEKVVLNLISNALKFTMPEKGREANVDVIVAVADGRLRISVRDTGVGIPEVEMQNLFQRFHQVQGQDERKFGGTGIGLALVKEIVEFHMGEVSVASKVGEGSTFTLSFPTTREVYPDDRLDRRHADESVAVDRRNEDASRKLAQLIVNPQDLALADLQSGADPNPTPESTPVITSASRERLLLADDNADMLAYLATILRRDYDVVTAVDGEEAYQLAIQHLPQVIVSDVMMPKKNGYMLVRDLKKTPATRSIPVILVTAKADSYGKVQGIEYGADDYLTKPFNFMELRARIRQLLKNRALERSLAEKNEYLAKMNFDLVLSKKEVFLETIEALAFALEAKDPYTHGHSRRVSLLSTELARRLSLTELEIERVQIAAVLHDIGKLGIDDAILRKPGPLTPVERDIIERHPETGYRILESITALKDVSTCILLHHERFDGKGYPLRKVGRDIPQESRIIAVADTYDAMTSDRPYRKGLTHERAIRELREFSGQQFDPDCVRGFLDLYERRAPAFPRFPTVFPKAQG